MAYTAKFIMALHDDTRNRDAWKHTDLLYEYRGHKYIVTKHNNGYAFDSLKKQHIAEQERIDRMIEEQNRPHKEWKYEGSAQEGFDMFWDFINE